MATDNKIFNLEYQFDLYLERVNMKKELLAHGQYTEMKRCFIGACGQIMILLRDDLGALEDDEAVETMEDMLNQVGNFFINESNRQN